MTDDRTPDPRRGVFSTTLVMGGAPIALDAHLARLSASVRGLYGVELSASAAAEAVQRSRGCALGRLRLTATPLDPGGVRLDVDVEPVERSSVLPEAQGALDLRSARLEGWPAAHKWVDRRPLHALEARMAPAVSLCVAPDGSVRETTRGNVFVLGADDVLRTPPADGSILPGIARAQTIALAREAGVEVCEVRISIAEMQAAREAFATNAVRGVEPVRSLDGRPILALPGMAEWLAGELRRRWLSSAPWAG